MSSATPRDRDTKKTRVRRPERTPGTSQSASEPAPVPPPAPAERIPTREAARLLQRTPRSVLRLARAGVLSLDKPGRAHARFVKSEVIELARRQGIEVGAAVM